jgi:glycosyltransferase involved in cell wall biosynthesis
MPKLTIGWPIYNGGEGLPKKIEQILSQSFSDFELIISVDAGTDDSVKICEKYAKLDPRINLFKHDKRMGWMWSFGFVLKQAKTDFFAFGTSDDEWDEKTYLEKLMKSFEENPDYVSIAYRLERYGGFLEFLPDPNDSVISKIYKKFRRSFRPWRDNEKSLTGTINEKASIALRNIAFGWMQGIHKTNLLQESSCYDKPFSYCDWAIAMNMIKHGDIKIIDGVGPRIGVEGLSSNGIFSMWKTQQVRWNEYVLPYSSFSLWCAKNFGLKFSLKNLDFFIWLNFMGLVAIVMGIVMRIKKSFMKI